MLIIFMDLFVPMLAQVCRAGKWAKATCAYNIDYYHSSARCQAFLF